MPTKLCGNFARPNQWCLLSLRFDLLFRKVMLLSMMFLLLPSPFLCGFSAVWSFCHDITCRNAVPGALPPQVLALVSCRKEIYVLHFSVCPFQGAGQCRNRPGVVAGFGVTTWALEGNPGVLSKGPRNAGGTRCCTKSCLMSVVPVISAYKYIPFFIPGKSHLHSLWYVLSTKWFVDTNVKG